MQTVDGMGLQYDLVALLKRERSDPKQRPQPSYRAVAYFPWNENLWRETLVRAKPDRPLLVSWPDTVATWAGVAAMCGVNKISLFKTSSNVELDEVFECVVLGADLVTIAWVVDPRTLRPLLLAAGEDAVIYVVDVVTRSVNRIRGHGGPIRHLAVHPGNPFIFASTSRDNSVRVYDLSLDKLDHLPETHWPLDLQSIEGKKLQLAYPNKPENSRGKNGKKVPFVSAGAPMGSGVTEGETTDIGRCVLILRGEMLGSGGHAATASTAAFHATMPFLATAGVDRAVKIWRLPPEIFSCEYRMLSVEDKPVFSTSHLHDSHVTSIHWLSRDVLITKSSGDAASLVVWKWLELQRFSPPPENPAVVRKALTDFGESRSFAVLFAIPTPWAHKEELHIDCCNLLQLKDEQHHSTTVLALPTSRESVFLWEAQTLSIPTVPPPDDARSRTQALEHPLDSDSEASESRKLRRTVQSDRSSSPLIDEDAPESYLKLGVLSTLDLDPGLESMDDAEREHWEQGLARSTPELGLCCAAISPFGAHFVIAGGPGETVAAWKLRS